MGAAEMAASGVGAAVEAAEVVVPAPRRPATTRDRLIDAAVVLTTNTGWAAVTMAKLAAEAGVSRQTVYNDIGTKADLADAMILRELEHFLDGVTRAFDQFPDDLVAALRAVSYDALVAAEGNQLLHAILSATHGADTALLPLLTSRGQALLGFTCDLIRGRVDSYDHELADEEVATTVDAVVRVVLSQMMRPSGSPDEIADGVDWLLRRVLRA